MILPKKDLPLFQTALKVGAVYTSGGKGYVIRDLFRLVAAAKSGGEKGYAFRVAENGYTDGTRGFMIDGALPYWNIWSPDSPGRFFVDIDQRIKLRMKFDAGNSANPYYRAALGYFANYDTNAEAPYVNCTNAVNGVIDYYPSFALRLVFLVTCSGINWKSVQGYIDHFYIKVIGTFALGGSENEIALIESPSYVNTDGTTRSYNQQYELKNLGSTYQYLRFEMYVGYTDTGGEKMLFKVPYIESQTVRLNQRKEGLSPGNFLWFYIYNPNSSSGGYENVAIPDYETKIPVSNKEIEFQPNSGTPYDGRYVLKFSAKIVGDYYTDIPGYGTVDIHGYYDVLAKGFIYKNSGGEVNVDYESLGQIYLDTNSEYNNFQLQIPTEWASNKLDSGTLHFFIRMKSQP